MEPVLCTSIVFQKVVAYPNILKITIQDIGPVAGIVHPGGHNLCRCGLPGGNLSSDNHSAESSWSSFREATRQMDFGQVRRANLELTPLKMSLGGTPDQRLGRLA